MEPQTTYTIANAVMSFPRDDDMPRNVSDRGAVSLAESCHQTVTPLAPVHGGQLALAPGMICLPLPACARSTMLAPAPIAFAVVASIAGCSSRPRLTETPRPVTASPLQLNVATGEELETARGEGRAVALELRLARRDEAAATGEVNAGPYTITYLITPATGYYETDPGVAAALTWHDVGEPGESHLGVIVRDTANGRLVEGIAVRATIRPRRGPSIARDLPLGWYPVLNRYGENVRLPSGAFSLRITIDTTPAVSRQEDGARDIQAVFSSVTLRAGAIERAAQRVATGDGIEGRELAQEEGVWERRAIDGLLSGGLAHGVRQRVSDYDVTIAVERQFDPSAPDSVHDAYLAVIVQDTASGREIPALNVRAQMLDGDGHVVATRSLAYVRHPWLSHHGTWWRVPRDGDYVFRVHADPPPLRRYGRVTGLEFRNAINIDLPAIHLSARRASGR